MPHRRRRPRDRRALHPERPVRPGSEKRRTPKDEERRIAEFDATQARLSRRRNLIALLALPFLGLVIARDVFAIPIELPRDILLVAFSAVFGGYLGLTIRMFLNRRNFAREVRPSTS